MFASRNRVISSSLLVLVLATAASAQQFVQAPIKQGADKLKLASENAIRNPAGIGAAQEDVDNYLRGFFFPSMTQTTAEALGEIATLRERLIKQYIGQAGNAATQEFLIGETFKFARGMARNNFHPAVRYNAALILGDLNSKVSDPQVPLKQATEELLELTEQEQFNKIPVPESVKLGAVLGLERHARLGIDPSLVDRLTKAMIGVINSKAPEDVDPAVHDWLRSTAALTLANQYAKTPNREAQAAIISLIADGTANLDDRCLAAAAFERITFSAGADINGKTSTDAMGKLTLDVITDAAKLAEVYQEEALSDPNIGMRGPGSGGRGYGGYDGGRGGFGGGGFGGGGVEEGPKFEMRQLFNRLYNIAKGSGSLAKGLGDDDKARLEALVTELRPVVEAMEDKDAVEIDVTEEVLKLQTTLTDLIKSWGQPVAAAEADKAEEGFAEN
jgi:uncharacterized membrane protein YgcG